MIESLLWVVATMSVPAAGWVVWRAARQVARGGVSSWRVARPVVIALVVVGLAVVAPIAGSSGALLVRALAQGVALMGAAASLALFASAIAGEPARGRRRCPRCWYDMSGTPGLVCPECGFDAKREARLFRARRRVRAFAACVVPVLVGASLYAVWIARQKSWVAAAPNSVLIALSPWQFPRDRAIKELMERVDAEPIPLLAWDRWLCAAVSRRVVTMSTDPHRALVHAWMLMMLEAQDESTAEAVLAFTSSGDDEVVVDATRMLRLLGAASEKVERRLVKLVEHEGQQVRDAALASLATVKEKRPGGAPATAVLAIAADVRSGARTAIACRVVGLCDPSEASRAALLATSERGLEWMRPAAAAALAQLYPDDAEVREALVRTITALGPGEPGASLVRRVLEDDERYVAPDGGLSTARRALYSGAVRAAMIDAANAAPTNSRHWAAPRRLLKAHPSLSAEERERLKAGTGQEFRRVRVRLPPSVR